MSRGPHNEGIQVTNDGATILKSIGVDNPAAKILVGETTTRMYCTRASGWRGRGGGGEGEGRRGEGRERGGAGVVLNRIKAACVCHCQQIIE